MSPKLSWSRWAVIGLIVLFTLIYFLPTVIGSKWVYEPLLRRFEAGDFKLSIQKANLSWFWPTSLSGIELSDNQGQHLLSVREIRNDRGLLSSLLNGRQLGRLTLKEPKLDIELLTEGSNLGRLTEALNDSASGSEAKAPPIIDIEIQLQSASVRVLKKIESGGNEELVVVPPFDLQVRYRSLDRKPALEIEPTILLDQVKLTPELIELGLDRAVPVLAKSAWFDGRLSIKTGRIEIPLLEPQKALGIAEITFHEVRSGPSDTTLIEILDFIAKLRGKTGQHEFVFVDGSILAIDMKDQRVTHHGLQLGLPRIDPRLQLASSGTVGLVDKSLDLALEVPLPVEQLARREEVRTLGVPTMTLPIRGSLDKPLVDWKAMRGEGADILGLIRERLASEAPGTAAAIGALEGIAEGKGDEAMAAALELVRRIGEARKSKRTEPSQESTEPDSLPDSKFDDQKEQSKPEKSNRPVLDALRNILRGEANQ
jgi:hypothetical protein